jgi:hypothetical protein
MSYFMTVSGTPPANSAEVEFLPVSRSEDYIRKLASELEQKDGSPLFLAHDGETGTSSGFISDGETHLHITGGLTGSSLHAILKGCVDNCDALRIWWASDLPNDHLDVATCTTFEEIIATITEQIKKASGIAVRWKKKSPIPILPPLLGYSVDIRDIFGVWLP